MYRIAAVISKVATVAIVDDAAWGFTPCFFLENRAVMTVMTDRISLTIRKRLSSVEMLYKHCMV